MPSDIIYQKVKVTYVPLQKFNEEDETYVEIISDEGKQANQPASEYDKEYFLNLLTKRQKAVAMLLFDGYDRVKIAVSLGVSVQAVHQIVPRIRKRLNQKAGIPLNGWKRRHGGY